MAIASPVGHGLQAQIPGTAAGNSPVVRATASQGLTASSGPQSGARMLSVSSMPPERDAVRGSSGGDVPASNPSYRRSLLRLSEYQKQVWQVEDGLPESTVRQIAQGADGKLLLATFAGVSTFDGQRFARLGLENEGGVSASAANAVLPGLHGDLWVGTDGNGVLHHTANSTVNISERAGILHERIRTMTMDRTGVLWIATQNGIERYKDGHLEPVNGAGMIAGDITTVFAEMDGPTETGSGAQAAGAMLFVTSKGLFEIRSGRLHALQIAKEYGAPVAAYRDPHHRLWIGTEHEVLEVLEDQRGGGDFLPTRRVLAVGSPVTAMAADSDGNLWVGTRHDGLWRYSGGAGSGAGAHLSAQDGLQDETIRSLFVDDEDNLWIGMLSGGLGRWRKAAFAPYQAPEVSFGYASVAFGDSRGDLWLGTWGQGLFRRHGETLSHVRLPGMQTSTPIRAITEDMHHNVWVGTWFDGMYRYDGRKIRHYRLGIESPVNAVSALLAHTSGGLWIGTYTGLLYFSSGEPNRGPAEHFLENKLITCLVQDEDGSVLVGTIEGLYRVKGGIAQKVEGMPQPYVLTLTRDSEGTVWAAPRSGGLVAVRDLHTEALHAAGNLVGMPIFSAVQDQDGHLWFGTAHGILRASVREMNRALGSKNETARAVLFGRTDGMRSSDCSGLSQPSATRMPDGTLWFATTHGFVSTTTYAEKVGPRVPRASIAGWSFSPDASAPLLRGESLEVNSGQSDLYINFDARNLANPGRIEFRYRLEGYDSDWTVTHSRVAHYQHLGPGSYRFQVQAHMSGTEWNSPIKSLPVRQEPEFYHTWYFYLGVAVLCAVLAVEVIRLRVRRMRASLSLVVEERNRIARECHDTLMAGFAAVSWQMEATTKRLSDGGNPQAAIESCELARSMVLHCQAEARRIIWDLRDSDEITGVLSHALKRAIDAHYRDSSIGVELLVEGEEFELPPNSVHHLVCIGQEAISNALRHASAQRIEVHLRFREDGLHMAVRDDGCGFQVNRSTARQGHFGLAVMEERARKLGGTFFLNSNLQQGTEILVTVPIRADSTRDVQLHLAASNLVRWIGI